ncbi:MAG: barstar family protein [Ardenticatenales bacterium]|nr:barstar family protein [Ardenticatenales bacterium]
MLVQVEQLSLDSPWRFAIVPLTANDLRTGLAHHAALVEIDGTTVVCMRSFHEEVAADLFFASHYNCDPYAPLAYLEAPVTGQQSLVWWHHAERMAERSPDEWEAVLQMFRAAMVTLHPQGTYLRMVFATNDPQTLHTSLAAIIAEGGDHAGVGFDYEAGESHLDILHESKMRHRLHGG